MQDYQAPADLLKDRIVMVTGAGSGIGRAAAKAYAAHGATVILVGRTVSRLEEVYDEIEAAGHPKPAIVPMNFEGAAVKDYEELAMTLEDNFGRLDGLLHNQRKEKNDAPAVSSTTREQHRRREAFGNQEAQRYRRRPTHAE